MVSRLCLSALGPNSLDAQARSNFCTLMPLCLCYRLAEDTCKGLQKAGELPFQGSPLCCSQLSVLACTLEHCLPLQTSSGASCARGSTRTAEELTTGAAADGEGSKVSSTDLCDSNHRRHLLSASLQLPVLCEAAMCYA